MYRVLTAVTAIFLFGPGVTSASAAVVKITATLTGTPIVVVAQGAPNALTGSGKLGAPVAYPMRVTSGIILQGRYVQLQGTILAPNGTVASTFVLVADKLTGAVKLTYKGARGTTITLTGSGSVTIV